jgi:ankyrin repeat protein
MIAAHKDQEMIVSLLLKAGAKADIKDEEGKTALQIAKTNGSKKAAVMLEKPTE